MKDFCRMSLIVVKPPELVGGINTTMVVIPNSKGKVLDAQRNGEILERIRLAIRIGKPTHYHETSDDALMFEER